MSKSELIQAIREHNRTASPEFLERFNPEDLMAYLERITVKSAGPDHSPPIRTTIDATEMLIVA